MNSKFKKIIVTSLFIAVYFTVVIFTSIEMKTSSVSTTEYNSQHEKEESDVPSVIDFNIEDSVKETIEESSKEVSIEVTEEQSVEPEQNGSDVLSNQNIKLTHYGPDCPVCSGQTAAGYYVGNTIYYSDATYGNIRVVASCSQIPLYSIIRINNYKFGGDTIAIVLDRGVSCGVIDLLVSSERESSDLGIQYTSIDILRYGR